MRALTWWIPATLLLGCPVEHAPGEDSGPASYDGGSSDTMLLDAPASADARAADHATVDTAPRVDAAACAQGCGAHEQCNPLSGLCECVSGYHRCGNSCVTDTSTAHCGSSCDPCPTTASGTSTCDGVSCGIRCDQDYLWCGARCAPCPTEGVATTSCMSGSCVAATCEQDYSLCGDGCCRFTLDTVETGQQPRMVLDDQDRPWLVYKQGDQRLRLARHTASGWQTETVTEGSVDLISPDLALDSDGNAHVVFTIRRASASGSVVHAVRQASGWTMETIVEAEGEFIDARLAITSDDDLLVVFHNWNDGTLLLASSGSIGWVVDEVARGTQLGRYCDIELDDSEEPHLSFMADNELRYAYHDGAQWQFQVVATVTGTQYISQSNLRFGPQARPRIAAFKASPRNVLFASFNGLTWDVSEVDTALGLFAGGVAMDLAADGAPHLSYAAYDASEVRHAFKSGASWSIEVVDRTQADDHTHLAIDSAGGVHIVYTNSDGDVVHAH